MPPRAAPAEPPLAPAWAAWAAELERTYVALLTVCALFHQREAECTLPAIKAAVERMTQLPLDARTLRVLGAVHDVVGLEGDDAALTVRIDFAAKTRAAKKRRRSAGRGRRAG